MFKSSPRTLHAHMLYSFCARRQVGCDAAALYNDPFISSSPVNVGRVKVNIQHATPRISEHLDSIMSSFQEQWPRVKGRYYITSSLISASSALSSSLLIMQLILFLAFILKKCKQAFSYWK
jgi:hypothetical protein